MITTVIFVTEILFYTSIAGECLQCGDKCIPRSGFCLCGNESIDPHTSFKHCCIPSNETCFVGDENVRIVYVTCTAGEVKPMSLPCDNNERRLQCFDSYEDYPQLFSRSSPQDLYSYYSCPDVCVPMRSNMCQGVRWCEGDAKVCGPNLVCANKYNTSLNIAPQHHYCKYKNQGLLNDGKYDRIDRSDEYLLESEESSIIVNLTQFKTCSTEQTVPLQWYSSNNGLTCGSNCHPNVFWCQQTQKGINFALFNLKSILPSSCSGPAQNSNLNT